MAGADFAVLWCELTNETNGGDRRQSGGRGMVACGVGLGWCPKTSHRMDARGSRALRGSGAQDTCRRRASMVLPPPGGPMNSRLCHPLR